jgi:catechol 2,3-dioxygenase-like lactoylglutathione lyase family enzyme
VFGNVTRAKTKVSLGFVHADQFGRERVERPVSEVIDHVGIRVSDLPASRRMYEAALAEIGFVVLSEGEFEGDTYVLFGRGDSDDFCLHTVGRKPGRDRVTTGAHIAFCASDARSVLRWHQTAVDHGGIDNGPPGVRPEYSGHYYAAFVLDPDGNNVEAVFHSSTDVIAEQ